MLLRCPLCFTKVSPAKVVALSNDLVCPTCRTPLEISRTSRIGATLTGGLLAALGLNYIEFFHRSAAWALGLVFAVVVFGFASAILLFFFADLVVRHVPPAAAPAGPSHAPHSHA